MKASLAGSISDAAPSVMVDGDGGVGVLLSGSPRGIPRRVVISRDSLRSERDGARNTRI